MRDLHKTKGNKKTFKADYLDRIIGILLFINLKKNYKESEYTEKVNNNIFFYYINTNYIFRNNYIRGK